MTTSRSVISVATSFATACSRSTTIWCVTIGGAGGPKMRPTLRVAAGIDLEKGAQVRIDSTTRTITVSLPPAQVLSVDVLNVTTYDESAGLLNRFRPEDRDAIQRMVRAQLETAARQSGILAHADHSAARVLTELLAKDGHKVEIVRPMVQSRPTG